MKDSGIEWIGEIPEDWEVVKVKDAFIRKNVKANQENPVVLSLARSGIKIRDISNNEGQLASDYSNYNPVEVNDLLLNPMDLISGDNCNISKVVGVISPAYYNLRYKKGINPEFYNLYFKNLYWRNVFFAHGKGVSYENRWTLNYETLSQMRIPFPTIDEQNKISKYLIKKLDKIENIKEIINNEIQTLEDYKKSVITEAVTKGLDKNVEMKDSGIEWIGEIPKHWKMLPNKYLMKKIKLIKSKYEGENILSLTRQGVIVRDLDGGGKFPTSFNGYQILKNGNLLLCLFDYDVTPRTVGKIEEDGLTSPAYSQYEMKDLAIRDYYYYYYLMLDDTKELLHLSKNLRSSFNETEFGNIKAPVPERCEQNQIVDYLDKKTKLIDESISIKQKQLETLEEYKKSLIYEYVTGKKEVNDGEET